LVRALDTLSKLTLETNECGAPAAAASQKTFPRIYNCEDRCLANTYCNEYRIIRQSEKW
jgi:hypothetical protein